MRTRQLLCGLAITLVLIGCQETDSSKVSGSTRGNMKSSDDGFVPLRRLLLGFVIEHDADRGAYRVRDQAGHVLFTGGLERCEEHLVMALKQKYGTGNLNLPFATLGGKQFWGDCFLFHGWRIQQNVYTGHYRLLDGGHVRRAWGTYEACRTAFEEIRLEKKLALRSDHLVLLLHGMGRSKDSFGCGYFTTTHNPLNGVRLR